MNDGATMSWSELGLLIFLSLLWGGSFFFAKVAVVGLPPLTIVFIRFAAAALLVLAYVRTQAIPIPADRRSWAAFAGMGLLNNLIPAGLIVWGQTRIPSGLAAVIIATTPVFSILAIRCTSRDERLTAGKLAGIVLGLAGVEVWAAMIGLAALSTALGYVVFFRLLASAGATNVSLVTLLIPVSAVLLGSLVLGERVAADQVVGMALIALGLLAIDGRLLRWRRG